MLYRGFRKAIESNEKWRKVYNNLKVKPKAFDVSLRDGLQTSKQAWSTNNKIQLYNKIIHNYGPKNIEIGSLCSEKVFPIFKDSIQLYNHFLNDNEYNKHIYLFKNLWLLVAHENQLRRLYDNNICPNLSFITSVSDSFQQKNTKMDVKTSLTGISNMLYILDDSQRKCMPLTKLYVSCINECPIDGKMNSDYIVSRLLPMFQLGLDKVCLSDTCGTLLPQDFDLIMRKLIVKNVSTNQIGLHLHVRDEKVCEQIIWKALDYGIMDFDVSALDKSGGCSVTLNRNQLAPNLSYDLYYRSILGWIASKS